MTRAKYLTASTTWDEAGRPDSLLIQDEWELLAMRCWFVSSGAEREGRDPLIADFGDASEKLYEQTSPHWWGTLLRQRHYCERCCETYRIENLAVCTGCLSTYCHRCIVEPASTNGNYRHHCGGELVG